MKTMIMVQARMGSTRLPGKVLKEVLGKSLLHYQLERLMRVKNANKTLLLTTTEEEDDILESHCSSWGIPCFRGSTEDVLDRYYQAAKQEEPDLVVRITGDCPLIDSLIIDKVITAAKENYPIVGYVSNSLIRTYPRGMDTEVFTYQALQEAHKLAKASEEREHVTLYIYRHPEKFTLLNVSNHTDQSQYRLTVDTEEDFALVKLLIEDLYPRNSNFSLEDIISVLKHNSSWLKINAHIIQKPV